MINNPQNRLAREKSPYLLQHADNPVDWYPWGEEAFEKARRENKPILVSIGYSTCHWCHVMEKESFCNPEIAAVMNQHLVCIKVDREERPDVDKIYMTAVQALTGSGGWPLNAFLTPELKPFFGGTYFPPDDRYGRVGWPELVERIGRAWQDPEQRNKILASASNITEHMGQALTGGGESSGALTIDLFEGGFPGYRNSYDERYGGFGPAPKFPMSVHHNYLLKFWAWARTRKPEEAGQALSLSLNTLRAMAQGGIFDQIGGGFHRYSTDERWHVPHFEKMLYDNAQLASNYVDAFQISRDPFFEKIARDTLGYILRDMTHPDGGFFSAEDADSALVADHSHKVEGAFYVWEKEEILKILGPEQGEIFCDHYGVLPEGNARQDPHGEFKQKNILYVARTLAETAKKFGKIEADISRLLEDAGKKLFAVRALRPRPHLDDKVLASWNGLMISAFARAAQVLGDPLFMISAKRAAGFIQTRLYDPKTRQLHRRWRDGDKAAPATSDDYAFLAQAALDLYEASFEPSWLDWAVDLCEELIQRFYDKKDGGFFMTEEGHDGRLLFRVKEDSDNVEPAAGSVAAHALARLAHFTDRDDFRNAAQKTLEAAVPQMQQFPRSLPQMLVALQFALHRPSQIIIAGDRASQDTQALLKEARSRFMPNASMMLLDCDATRARLSERLPFLKNIKPVNGRATAYVCVDYACELPTNDLATFKSLLDSIQSTQAL